MLSEHTLGGVERLLSGSEGTTAVVVSMKRERDHLCRRFRAMADRSARHVARIAEVDHALDRMGIHDLLISALTLFDFHGNHVRVHLDEQGEPWLVAADTCRCLEHSSPAMAIRALADDEEGLREVETPAEPQRLWTVAEGGLHEPVLRRRCQKAARFQRSVSDDVLPSIRKTGSYGTIKINVRDADQLAPIGLASTKPPVEAGSGFRRGGARSRRQ